MKVLVIFAHPSHKSYNYCILEEAIKGLKEKNHEIMLNDLFGMKFDPAMTDEELYRTKIPDLILQEQDKVKWSDAILCIFPIWWWGPPAVLKGWLERVLCLNFAFKYDINENGLVGTLQNRKAVIISTGSSLSPEAYKESWQMASHNGFVSSILSLCGFSIIRQMNFYDIHDYTPKVALDFHLNEVYEFTRKL